MMLQAFIVPVFFHSDETLNMKHGDVDFPLSQCEQRDFYFYHINGIAPYYDAEDGDREYASIHTNDSEYITPYPVEELVALLETHLRKTSIYIN